MKIAFFECEKDEVSVLKKALSGHNLTFFPEALDEKNAGKAGDAEIACVFIYSKINSRAIEKMRNLKLIVTRSTGYDHIDIEACKKRGILISNIPRYGENTVAEHAFSLLLALSRKIREAKEQIEKKKINIKSLECFDLKGKTLGVIGAGRIGLSMIKMAKGFNMNVIAYDTYQNNEAAKELGFSYVSFDELLRSSDVITIHALLTEKTYHLMRRHLRR